MTTFILSFRVLLALATASLTLQAQTGTPKPSPEREKMRMLVGNWDYEGEYFDSPLGPPKGKFQGKVEARLILGGVFLQINWEEVNPGGPFQGHEIHGYSPEEKRFEGRLFYSDGSESESIDTFDGNVWTSESMYAAPDGKKFQVKGVWTYAPNHASYKAKIEISGDGGKTWSKWQEFTGKKVAAVSSVIFSPDGKRLITGDRQP